jgi:hypothetical protein
VASQLPDERNTIWRNTRARLLKLQVGRVGLEPTTGGL